MTFISTPHTIYTENYISNESHDQELSNEHILAAET